MSLISVVNLSKSFGKQVVLRNVNLQVEKGDRIVIIGGSGCGKSVFLRSIEMLEKPDCGHIFFNGEDITAKGVNLNKIRQNMGMVYQGFHLFEHRNVIDNITLAPIKLKGISRQKAEEKACELLSAVGLENRKYDMPNVLSGGQKQRIAIARCMCMEPEVILFDEPTSALDPSMAGEVLATMRLLAKSQMTMIIVTHEMEFAREIGTRILYFDENGIYEQGTPEEIFDFPKKPKTQTFVRKLKFLSYHIRESHFDLMRLQGGIQLFAEKYGMTEKVSGRLQLVCEELLYEMIEGAYGVQENVHIDLTIEYSKIDGSILLFLDCYGRVYNPFESQREKEERLGIQILNSIARSIQYENVKGMNQLIIKI